MLKDIPAQARPREKLLAQGPAALADVELIALLLRTGLPGTGVLQLAQNLLDTFGGLSGLLRAGPDELKRVKGLGGNAKRAEVAAVLELARRSVAGELSAKPVFDTPGKVKDYLALQLGARAHEVFAVLFLDAQSRLIVLEEMFRGTLTQTSVYVRRTCACPPAKPLAASKPPPFLAVCHQPEVRHRLSRTAIARCSARERPSLSFSLMF
jgi:DNA repair protein RadC